MAQDNVLNNIFGNPSLWEQMRAIEALRLKRIEQEREAQKFLPNCARCKTSKVYKSGANLCLSCSYC
ncbi:MULTISPECIES: hypothetical protein [unclassified Psychrobacter]|uniref:hypothetical protein n=1 Tax=unclassified Psychrobacter TaxID=196806 RepID=UPI0025E478F9|nr:MULTISPECIES: hypothetical protein [unclassified Psychrobacter]